MDVPFSCFSIEILTSYREAMPESSDVDHIWLKVMVELVRRSVQA